MVCVYRYMYSLGSKKERHTYEVRQVVLLDGLRVRGLCIYIYVFFGEQKGTPHLSGKASSVGGWTEMD